MYSLVFRTRTGKIVHLPMEGAGIDDIISLAEIQIRCRRIVLGYTVRENGRVFPLTSRGVKQHKWLREHL